MDYWMGMILGNCFLSAAGRENCERNGHVCWTIMWAPGLAAASRAAIRLKVWPGWTICSSDADALRKFDSGRACK